MTEVSLRVFATLNLDSKFYDVYRGIGESTARFGIKQTPHIRSKW